MNRMKALAASALLLFSILPMAQQKDIVDMAAAAGTFKSLAAALQAAGLVQTLTRAGPLHGLRSHRRSLREDPEGGSGCPAQGQGEADG